MTRQKLYHALKKCQPALATKDIIPVFACFCFSKDHVMAYDDLIAIQHPMKSGITGAVKGDVLLNWLSSLRGKELEIKQGDSSVVFKSGRPRLEVPILPEDDFLFEFPKKKAIFELEVTPDLASLIDEAKVSMGQDPSHAWRLGITFATSPNGMELYSCDNVTATRIYTGVVSEKSFTVVAPPRFCDLLTSLIKTEGMATVKLSGKWLVAELKSGVKLFSRATAKPDLEQYKTLFKGFDSISKKEFVDRPKPLDRALERAKVVLPYAKEPYTNISVSKGFMHLYTKSDGAGEVRDKLQFDGHSEIEIDFLPDLILRTSKKVNKMKVTEKFIAMKGKNVSYMVASVIRGGSTGDKDEQGRS